MRLIILLSLFITIGCNIPTTINRYGTEVVSDRTVALSIVHKFALSNTKSLYMDSLKVTKKMWLKSLRAMINEPEDINATSETNFCSKAPLSVLIAKENPVGFAQLMIDLYKVGKGQYFNGRDTIMLELSPRLLNQMALNITGISYSYTEKQTINPVFATLAYALTQKYNWGWDKKYDVGDENKVWAATPLIVENNMIKHFCGYRNYTFGFDFLTNSIDLDKLKEAIDNKNHIYLLVNSQLLHNLSKIGRWVIGTHYIDIKKIDFLKKGKELRVVWWEYGRIFEQTFERSAFRGLIAGGIIFKSGLTQP